MNSKNHTKQLLKRVYGMLVDQEKWTKKSHARLESDTPCCWWDRRAVKFSLYGALRRCCNFNDEFQDVCIALHERMPSGLTIISFNDLDKTEHHDIIKLFDNDEDNSIVITHRMIESWEVHKDIIVDVDMAYYTGYREGINTFYRRDYGLP